MVDKIHELEIRIIKLESHLRTAIIVAIIFGFTGAWGFNLLTKSNEKLNKLKGDIAKLDENTKVLQDKIRDINVVLTSSIKSEIENYVNELRNNIKADIDTIGTEKLNYYISKLDSYYVENENTKEKNLAYGSSDSKDLKLPTKLFGTFVQQEIKDGDSYISGKEYDKAVMKYQKIISHSQDYEENVVAYSMLMQAFAFINLGDIETAIVIIKKLRKRYPTSEFINLGEEILRQAKLK